MQGSGSPTQLLMEGLPHTTSSNPECTQAVPTGVGGGMQLLPSLLLCTSMVPPGAAQCASRCSPVSYTARKQGFHTAAHSAPCTGRESARPAASLALPHAAECAPPTGHNDGSRSACSFWTVPGTPPASCFTQECCLAKLQGHLPVQPAIARDAGVVGKPQGERSGPRIHKQVQPGASWQAAQRLLQILSPDLAALRQGTRSCGHAELP